MLDAIGTEIVSTQHDPFDDCFGLTTVFLDLEHITFAGNHFIQHGIHEESDE